MKDRFQGIEKFINNNLYIVAILTLYQGTMGANNFKTPEILKPLFQNEIWRFLSLCSISYTATKDIEQSVVSTLIFLFIIKVLNSFDENKPTQESNMLSTKDRGL